VAPEVPTYRLHGSFVSPDVKYSGDVATSVSRNEAPTDAEATETLYPLAEADVLKWRGDTYQCWFTSVTIEEQP
jgi:hypothetical protein